MKTGKLKKGLKILLILILLGIAGMLILMGLLTWAEKHVEEPHGEYDAIVVLGAQVRQDGSLSLQLEYRLEKGYEAFQKYGCPVIVCGAQGSNEPATEGLVMREWMLEKGVPPEKVISETDSYNTRENLENAKKLMPEGAKRILIVTSEYHVPRALKMAEDMGLEASGLGSPLLPQYWLKNHFREVLAWGKYYLEKVISAF